MVEVEASKSTKVDDCDYQRCSKGFRMGRMNVETRSKVILLWKNGYPVTVIQDRLFQEGVKVSLFVLIKKFKSTVLVIDLPRKPRTSLLSGCHYRFIYEKMTADNELTSRQLFSLFTTEYPDIETSISTIKRAHLYLGWISKKTRYCALIREENKEKRLQWCKKRLKKNDLKLSDVIFTDESSVQLESHRKTSYRKVGQPSRLCARPKHPVKVHVWGGISARVAVSITMTSTVIG